MLVFYRHKPLCRGLKLAGLLMLLFSGMTSLLNAQFDSASVLGKISDPSGAAIRSAHITLTDVKREVSSDKLSDTGGDYEFLNVTPGEYRIKVTADGFQTTQTADFSLVIGARQRVDLALVLGSTSTSITVDGAASQLETETSDRGETVQSAQAVSLPLNGRSYADLAIMVPGVKKSTLEATSFPARDASYNVNGLTSQSNNFQLDGIDNNAYQEANQGYSNEAIVPSPDAIQEFKVQTDNFSAEFGRAGGAIINATTKSGGAQIHGGAYDYLRNTVLNAYGPFIGTGVKPTLVQNQFGGTFGGPAIKNHLFYFGDYEGLRSVARSLSQTVLPTDAERQGTFTVDGTTNNSTGNIVTLQNPYSRAVYSNGQVPLSDSNIDPLATFVFKNLPEPNIPGAALTANNYQYMAPNTVNDQKGDGRADFVLNQNKNGFFRYSQRSVDYYTAPAIPGIAGGNSNGNLYAHTRQIAAGFNWVLSSNSILELRFGQTWTDSGKKPVNLGQTNELCVLGFLNVPCSSAYTGGVNTQVVGSITFGEQWSNPQYNKPTQANPKVNYSFVHGHHSVKVGYEFGWMNQAISDFHPKFGEDYYANKYSNVAASNASIKSGIVTQSATLADFLWGARSSYILNNVAEVNYQRNWDMGYIQDDWKILPNLTVNIGMRYEFVTPDYEQNNHILNYDPVNNRILHAGSGTDANYTAGNLNTVTNTPLSTPYYNLHYMGGNSLANRALINPDYKDFGPRIGFAWQPRNKTVVRAGYAISYSYLFRYGGEGILAYNGPDIIATTGTNPSSVAYEASSTTVSQCDAYHYVGCVRRTQDGYPYNFTSSTNYSSAAAETRYRPANFRTPYVQSYHFSVQQQLPANLTLEVAYVGSHGVELPALYDYNQATLCPSIASGTCSSSILSRQTRAPGFTDILTESNLGFLLYNSLQTKLTRQFSHGLFMTNAFTWSKSINNSAADLESNGGDAALVNINNVRGDRGLGSYNQPLNDTLTVIADLPFGRGKIFANHIAAWQDEIIGGWQVTAVNVVTSGLPINPNYSAGDICATCSVFNSSLSSSYSLRPNLVTTAKAAYSHHTTKTSSGLNGYFNTSSFSLPAGTVLFGNSPRNGFVGPAFGQLDLGLHKEFKMMGDRAKLQFRLEAFNALNATNFAVPTTLDPSSSSFGQFTSSQSSVYSSRQVQSALRLEF